MGEPSREGNVSGTAPQTTSLLTEELRVYFIFLSKYPPPPERLLLATPRKIYERWEDGGKFMKTGIIVEKKTTAFFLLSFAFQHIINKIKPGSVTRVYQLGYLYSHSALG